MKRIIITAAITLTMFSSVSAEAVDVNHFLICPSTAGVSGFIYNPSAYVLPHMVLSLGLHRFIFTGNVGLFDIVEAGIIVNFAHSSDVWEIAKSTDFNLKARILKEEEAFVSFAAGIERFPINVFEPFPPGEFKLYMVVSKKVTDMNFTVGVKKPLDGNNLDFLIWDFMVDVSKVVADTVLLVAEYDSGHFNAGVKISLNYNISVEMFIQNIESLGDANEFGTFLSDHFIFGITYIQ